MLFKALVDIQGRDAVSIARCDGLLQQLSALLERKRQR
jgi:hypothetical protein